MDPIVVSHLTPASGPARLLLSDGRQLQLAAGKQLAFAPQRELWCTGSTPPGGGRVRCPDGRPAERGAQCQACFEASRISACLRCVGERCLNPARRAGCADEPHLVYLADFSGELKVGICRTERFAERLREQGAHHGLEVLRAGGLEVRRVERLIVESGVADRVDLPGLLGRPALPEGQARAVISERFAVLCERIPELGWYPAGRFLDLTGFYPPPACYRMLSPAVDVVGGHLLGTRGGLLLARDAEGGLTACALRSLHGRRFVPVGAERTGPAQLQML